MQIEKAEKVVIVGGGAVGCEMAGEIVEKYRDKTVTIIHSGPYLVTNRFGEKFQNIVQENLKYQDIKVVMNERASNLYDLTLDKFVKQTVTTEKGQEFEADIVLKCTGLRPNISLTKSVFGDNKLDEFGRLKVDEILQVIGEDSVYAIGDCCNTDEEKMAAHAGNHGEAVAANLIRELKGKEKLPYKSGWL